MKLLISALCLLTFTFAQPQTQYANAIEEAKAQLRKAEENLRALEQNVTTVQTTIPAKSIDKLSKLGLEIKGESVTIDINKTKSFFDNFAKILGKQIGKMTIELADGISDSNKTGIAIDEEHINIDMNKTQQFLDNLDKKMQGFVKEFDKIAEEFNIEVK